MSTFFPNFSFWGLNISPNSKISYSPPKSHILHLSSATLSLIDSPCNPLPKATLCVLTGGKMTPLCNLKADLCENYSFDLVFPDMVPVTFSNVGNCPISVLGYLQPISIEEVMPTLQQQSEMEILTSRKGVEGVFEETNDQPRDFSDQFFAQAPDNKHKSPLKNFVAKNPVEATNKREKPTNVTKSETGKKQQKHQTQQIRKPSPKSIEKSNKGSKENEIKMVAKKIKKNKKLKQEKNDNDIHWINKGKLKYFDFEVGKGKTIKQGDFLKIIYVGKNFKGEIINKVLNQEKPFSFKFGKGEVDKGWDVGMEGMKFGGKRKMIVPENMSFNKQKMIYTIKILNK